MTDIQEVYREDTVGRRYHTPIVTKGGNTKAPPVKNPVTLNLNKPLTRNEFKGLSDSLKILYITHLKQKHGATATQIAQMLGYSSGHFSRNVISALDLSGLFTRGGRVSSKQRQAWNKFIKSGTDKNEEQLAPSAVLKHEPESAVVSNTSTKFCKCSFTLKGELKTSDISDKIRAMVSDGTPCSISITIDALDEIHN